jgi:hypothetical protein
MKIRIVNSKEEIAKLDPREGVVHLTIPLTTIALLELIQRCPRLEAIEAPPYRYRTMFKSSRCLLDVQGVKVFPALIQGHRTDHAEYITVDEGAILQRAGELRAAGMDSGGIVAKVAEELEVSPGLVGFILDSSLR